MILFVSITPKSSKNELTEWKKDLLRVRIAAPPVDGKANHALLVFLADIFGLAPSTMTITKGQTNKKKLIHVPMDQKNAMELIARRIRKRTLL